MAKNIVNSDSNKEPLEDDFSGFLDCSKSVAKKLWDNKYDEIWDKI